MRLDDMVNFWARCFASSGNHPARRHGHLQSPVGLHRVRRQPFFGSHAGSRQTSRHCKRQPGDHAAWRASACCAPDSVLFPSRSPCSSTCRKLAPTRWSTNETAPRSMAAPTFCLRTAGCRLAPVFPPFGGRQAAGRPGTLQCHLLHLRHDRKAEADRSDATGMGAASPVLQQLGIFRL